MRATTIERNIPARAAFTEAAEWRFVGIVTALVLLITSLPYLYAHFSTPPDKVFMGLMLDVPDHGQYFSWMRELTTAPFAANKLTPEPNQAIFFNLLWWGLGRLSLLLGLTYAGMFQVLRLVSGALFLLLAYRVCAWFLDDRLQRRMAFLVIALTSGFGWVLVLLKYTLTRGELLFPLDVYIAEGNTFLGILGYPHFIAAALYIFVFDLVLRGEKRGQIRYAVIAGLIALFFGWQHAYDLILVYGILTAYTVFKFLRDRHDGRFPRYMLVSLVIIGFISWWPALYSFLLTTLDPIWEQVLAQFANAGVYTPNPLHLPILLGPAFLLALYTVIRRNPLQLRKFGDKELFLIAWFLANGVLIYIPTDFQIHMLNGWQVPIAILAVMGLFRYIIPFAQRHLDKWFQSPVRTRTILAAALILAVVPTNIYLWAWRFVDLSRHNYPYYLYTDEVEAMAWLDSQPGGDDVILSSIDIGQYLPAMTGKHAFLAHWAQTLGYYEKTDLVNEFFHEATSFERRESILDAYEVDYIFYGPAEQRLGGFDPASTPQLSLVFSNSRVQVFAVQE